MSKNILSDFKSYNDYKNNVILPLTKKNISELKISEKFSRNNDKIEELTHISKEKAKNNKKTKVLKETIQKEKIVNVQIESDNSPQEKSSRKDSYESNIEDIRNKILAFANLSKSKKEKELVKDTIQDKHVEILSVPTLPEVSITEVSIDKNLLKSEELFSKLGEPSKEFIQKDDLKEVMIQEDTLPKLVVQEIHLPKEVATKEVSQKSNSFTEHQVWKKCTHINTEEAYIEYITLYPKGIYHIAAEYRIKGIIKIY